MNKTIAFLLVAALTACGQSKTARQVDVPTVEELAADPAPLKDLLRCFLPVAEELHFARAAERLHIEQSPLSRTIKELEEELGVVLLARTTRSTRITRTCKLFLEQVPRVSAALE